MTEISKFQVHELITGYDIHRSGRRFGFQIGTNEAWIKSRNETAAEILYVKPVFVKGDTTKKTTPSNRM